MGYIQPTMNRFDRITAILIQLQSKKIVKAQDLADRFEISLRTVYRDIRSLEEAGVPLYGEAGVGYSLVDGYRLPPIMFTREEAMTFVTAEKFMAQFTDAATRSSYQSAMYKMKAVLRGDEKDLVENIEDRILVRKRFQPQQSAPENALDCILQCIAEQRAARLHYETFDAQQRTERTIEPIGIFHENQFWYVVAWCHLRGDYRQFRTDRMTQICATDTPFHKKHPDFKEYLEQSEKNHAVETVVIRVPKKIVAYMQGQRHYFGFAAETDLGTHVEMTFHTLYMEGFARWLLMFADHAEIVQPTHLKTQLRDLVAQISQNL